MIPANVRRIVIFGICDQLTRELGEYPYRKDIIEICTYLGIEEDEAYSLYHRWRYKNGVETQGHRPAALARPWSTLTS